MKDAIVKLTAEHDQLLAKIRPIEDDNVRLKALLENTEKQLGETKEEIKNLNREIGRLEASRDNE